MCQIWNFFVAYGANLPKISDMSRQNWGVAETIFSSLTSGASRVMVPDELIEMVQYTSIIFEFKFAHRLTDEFPPGSPMPVSPATNTNTISPLDL
jgi:hypothetical protein